MTDKLVKLHFKQKSCAKNGAYIKNVQKEKRQIVIAVSEGIRFSDGKLVAESEQKDAFGHGQLGGAAKTVSEYIKEQLGVKVRAVDYVADYVLTYSNGKQEVIDIKGFADSVALLKRKLFWYKYPELDYKWISYSKCDGGWIEYDNLKKARKARKINKSNKGE